MAFCLTTEKVTELKKALKKGEINPMRLAEMTSIARREFLAKYVGQENAKQVNALFESKLLLKNQKAGYITWAKKITGITPAVRQDLLSKIERLDRVLDPAEGEQFLQDLASTRLRINVTQQEAKTISDLSKKMNDLKVKANEEGVFSAEADRLKYGVSKVALERYVNDLKLDVKKISFREQPIKKVLDIAGGIPGDLKSLMASFDNSFWGRQGIKTLLDIRTSHLWIKNFAKSFLDAGKQLTAKGKWYTSGNDAVIDAIKADIYSRPNALNGKYQAGRYGLDVLSEEAYPSARPEKIPLLGRLFKVSEAIYNGGALRLRADLADRLIRVAEKQGVNTLDPVQAQGMGHLISSLTGRGSIHGAEPLARKLNVIFFSIKFLKSNFDILTAHITDPKVQKSSFARKEAAKNLLSIIATLASIFGLAKLIDPDSVDEEPRSSNFGKIKMFGHWRDITGGMSGLARTAAYLVPKYHNGKWSLWKKTSTGRWIDLRSGAFGGADAFDTLIQNLFTNKLSPIAGLLRDGMKGEFFGGEPFGLKQAFKRYTTPISIQNYEEFLDDPNTSSILGDMILEGLGLSSYVYIPKAHWGKSTSAELLAFRKQVGEEQFKRSNDDFNRVYAWWYNETTKKGSYKRLSEKGKQSLITKGKKEIKDMIFKANSFKYKKPKKTKEQKQESKQIKKLLP